MPLLILLALGSFGLRAWDASQGLHAGASFDERFSLRNVGGILKRGDWRPQQAFYPSLSYLPQTAVLFASEQLHRATGVDAFAIHADTIDRWSPTTYLLCRLTNVAFGTASLVLLFIVGRRLFGAGEGLLAAAALAAFPRHVVSSSHFKPDILVLLLTLLTFWWTLLAAERPRRRAFLRAGVGVGLATAAKYTGAGAAVALLVAVLARWRDRRQWRWLALAGAAAIATFVLLNPWLGRLLTFGRKLSSGYAATGASQGSDHWVVLQREVIFLVSHHRWVAAFLIAGIAGLAWRIARPGGADPPWDERRRLGATLLLGQLGGYAVLHAIGFPLFRGQNFLPVAPFTSLIAAWAMVELWRLLRCRLPALGRPAVAVAAWTVPAMLLAVAQWGIVYRAVVPTTWAAAGSTLARSLEHTGPRQVVFEGKVGRLRPTRGSLRALALPYDRLSAASSGTLDLADAEVVALPRLRADAFVRARADRAGVTTEVVRARPFSRRGEPVALLLHPWRLVATQPLVLAPAAGDITAALPESTAVGTPIMLGLWLPRNVTSPHALRLEPGGPRLRLYPSDRRRGDLRLVTVRFLLPAGMERVALRRPAAGLRPPRLELYRWDEP